MDRQLSGPETVKRNPRSMLVGGLRITGFIDMSSAPLHFTLHVRSDGLSHCLYRFEIRLDALAAPEISVADPAIT